MSFRGFKGWMGPLDTEDRREAGIGRRSQAAGICLPRSLHPEGALIDVCGMIFSSLAVRGPQLQNPNPPELGWPHWCGQGNCQHTARQPQQPWTWGNVGPHRRRGQRKRSHPGEGGQYRKASQRQKGERMLGEEDAKQQNVHAAQGQGTWEQAGTLAPKGLLEAFQNDVPVQR